MTSFWTASWFHYWEMSSVNAQVSSSDGRTYMLGNGVDKRGYVVYNATGTSFSLSGLAGGPYEAHLFDPTSGNDTVIQTVTGGSFSYQPPGNNSVGDADWVVYFKP